MSWNTLAQAAADLDAGEVSAVEMATEVLARIEAHDPVLNAYVHVARESALAAAACSDARRSAGAALSVLDGAPIAHKDNFLTSAMPTCAHSTLLAGWRPERDAELVRSLDAAGLISLGKLTCYEFAFAGPSQDLATPSAKNPWDLRRSAAGSSSGSAVAVAARLALGASGSDTGGSVRDPAALCGVTGLKPTYGRLSQEGLIPFSRTLDHPGLLAVTAQDCALLLDAATATTSPGRDPSLSPTAPTAAAAGLKTSLAGVRVGVLRCWHEREEPADEATLGAVEAALQRLERLGVQTCSASLPPLADYHACGWPIALAELYAVHAPWLRAGDGGQRYGGLLRSGLAIGASLSASDYLAAMSQRDDLRRQTLAELQAVDLFVTVVQAGEAPLEAQVQDQLPFEKLNYTMPFNVTGQPAISIPAGLGPHGLPLAIQIIARPFEEPLLLRVAHALQAAPPFTPMAATMIEQEIHHG